MIPSPSTGSGFIKQGAGTLRIDGNATNFSGNLTVSVGVSAIGNRGTSGNLGTGTITLVDPGIFTVRRQGTLILSNPIIGSTTGGVNFHDMLRGGDPC